MKYTLLILLTVIQSVSASSPVWLVESAQNRLFLAGTIHVLRASDYPLPAAFETAYKQSQLLSFETDIKKSKSTEFQLQLMQAVTLNQNQNLQDFLSPQTYEKLKSHFKSNQLNLEQFSRFKPSMIALTLTMLELKKLGAGSFGVDLHYFDKAVQDNKKTLALESLQQQIDFLVNMGKGQENQMIQQTLAEIETLPAQFSNMISSWRDGDYKQLETLFIKPMQQGFDAIYQDLLVQRNLNWLPQIIQYMQTPEIEMVLVGTAHLLGEDGLINHLQQAGYKITPLN